MALQNNPPRPEIRSPTFDRRELIQAARSDMGPRISTLKAGRPGVRDEVDGGPLDLGNIRPARSTDLVGACVVMRWLVPSTAARTSELSPKQQSRADEAHARLSK
jgi:hypothetical protein